MNRLLGLLLLGAVMGAAAAAQAQNIDAPVTAKASLPSAPPVVLHQPYIGTRATETHTILADGTTIDRTSSTEEARDSLGRTWRHWTAVHDAKHDELYSIYDPMTRTSVTWCSCSKSAGVRHFGLPRTAHPAPTPVPSEFTAYLGNDVEGHLAFHVETLPPQTLFGLPVRGSRAVRTVPPGKEGNSKPLTTTVESWYSEDLHLPLDTIIDDPVKGLSRHHFTALSRDEPEAARFVPPNLPQHEVTNAP